MANHYNLNQIREIADGDSEFIIAIVSAFLDEVPQAIEQISKGIERQDHLLVYQNAHMLKPTFAQFGIKVYDDLILLQDWGKNLQTSDVNCVFQRVLEEVSQVVVEMKIQFDL